MAKATGVKKIVKKRRERKNVEAGAAHLRSTVNNTIVTITDTKGFQGQHQCVQTVTVANAVFAIAVGGKGFLKGLIFLGYHAKEGTKGGVLAHSYNSKGIQYIRLNGKDVCTLLFDHTVDLAPYLQEGKNELCLALTNSCRNLLGPHHFCEAEPHGVNPCTFSFEKQWQGGSCDAFLPSYAFVRFGIDLP